MFYNQFMFEEGNSGTVETKEEKTETIEPSQTEETSTEPTDPKKTRNEVLRDLSKELGVNLFEADGMKQVKTLIDSQKTEQEKAQEKLEALNKEREQWEQEKQTYEAKLKASELGISKDALEDALKLAGNDPDKLATVVEKYPMFKTGKGVKIGVQNPNNNSNPTGKTEVEEYMAKNPKIYKKFLDQNKN